MTLLLKKHFRIGQNGTPNLDPKKTIPRNRRNSYELFPFDTTPGDNLYLLVRVGGFQLLGGLRGAYISSDIEIGSYKKLVEDQQVDLIEAGLIAGMLLLMGLYNIILYLQRQEDRASLMIGLFSLLYVLRHISLEGLWSYVSDDNVFIENFTILMAYTAVSSCILLFAQFLKRPSAIVIRNLF